MSYTSSGEGGRPKKVWKSDLMVGYSESRTLFTVGMPVPAAVPAPSEENVAPEKIGSSTSCGFTYLPDGSCQVTIVTEPCAEPTFLPAIAIRSPGLTRAPLVAAPLATWPKPIFQPLSSVTTT